MAPDGDVAYLGRGQGQVWVPALTAAALAGAARDAFATRPGLAARYLAGAQRAVQRLGQLHAGATGLQLVPNAATRTTHDGIDGYASDVAYNGLALFGLSRTADALAAIPAAPVGVIPADRRLTVVDNGARRRDRRSSAAAGSGSPSTGRRATRATCATTRARSR